MNGHAGAIFVIVLGVAGLILVAGIFLARRSSEKRTQRLRTRFGVEYDRLAAEHGDRRAKELLEERERRSLKLTVRPISAETRERFAGAWRAVQGQFVDAPGKSLIEADRLLEELMSQRGFSVGDYEQQTSDLSVHYPGLVQNYRVARVIADKERHGEAATEDLRAAMIQYRVLYEELLGRPISHSNEVNYETQYGRRQQDEVIEHSAGVAGRERAGHPGSRLDR